MGNIKMNIRRMFVMIAAVMLTSAVFADSASVTSKKYVDDFMAGYQNKIPGSGADKLMIYDDSSDGIGEKNIVSSLGSNTSATDVPNVGAVKAGMDGKQDTINGTAGYVMTGTGNAGSVGERAIYGTAVYSNSLVTAETVNTGVTNAVNSSLIRVDANGNPSNTGTLWEINTDLYALGVLPAEYTQLEWIESSGTQCINTGYVVRETDSIEIDYVLTDLSRTGDKFIIGAQPIPDNPNVGFWTETYDSSNTWYVRFGSSSSANTYGITTPSSQLSGTLVVSKNSFVVNGTKILTPEYYGMSPNPLTIFNRITAAGDIQATGASAQISEVRIKNGNNIVHKYVPAKNSSNVIGMYDTVSGQFFQNLGSGNFTAGPQVGN